MIYPTFGISIFVHLFVIVVSKTKKLLGIHKKKGVARSAIFLGKTFRTFAVSLILVSVLFAVVGSSVTAVYISISDKKSNGQIVEDAIKNYENTNHARCSVDVCYSKVKIPNALNLPA